MRLVAKDMELLRQMLEIDSSSGVEAGFASWCLEHLDAPHKELFNFADGSLAVLLTWGSRCRMVMCSHLDTVTPYIAPSFDGACVHGRGSCDAKGQIWALYRACQALGARGRNDFALLLLSGEESGSKGARAWSAAMASGLASRSAAAASIAEAEYLLIGEPTDNCQVSASKGTLGFSLRFHGSACHSGYPQYGHSAVEDFVDFCGRLRALHLEEDPLLGSTSWNFGELCSANPQNILSAELSCRLYFRTTFASAQAVRSWMHAQADETLEITDNGGDEPSLYHCVDGIPSKAVAFGSDAPHLSGYRKKMICGPGSIMVAHRNEERVSIEELEAAVKIYLQIYESCN